jgi:V8-like Glu-specific endopeptidase
MRWWQGLVAAFGLAILVMLAGTATAKSPSAPHRQAPHPILHPEQTPEVGALFVDGNQTCTASVVHSPAGDLLLTAAHCVPAGDPSSITFVPGYRDGAKPYGTWTATRSWVPPEWSASADEDLDFAILEVHQPGNPASVESETGANTLATGKGFTNTVTLAGYPSDSDTPVICRNAASQRDDYQMAIACPGFPDGSSGSPWITDVDPRTGLGQVIGVIGGLDAGGTTPDESNSPYFDGDIAALYAKAVAGTP